MDCNLKFRGHNEHVVKKLNNRCEQIYSVRDYPVFEAMEPLP